MRLSEVTAGDSCSSADVQFSFEGCQNPPSASQMATKIICDKNTVKARWQEGDVRYEAQFEKTKDDKGVVTWKPVGDMRRLARKAASAPAVVTPTPAPVVAADSKVEPVVQVASAPTSAPVAAEPASSLWMILCSQFATKKSPTILLFLV
jgi:hypothetical protein